MHEAVTADTIRDLSVFVSAGPLHPLRSAERRIWANNLLTTGTGLEAEAGDRSIPAPAGGLGVCTGGHCPNRGEANILALLVAEARATVRSVVLVREVGTAAALRAPARQRREKRRVALAPLHVQHYLSLPAAVVQAATAQCLHGLCSCQNLLTCGVVHQRHAGFVFDCGAVRIPESIPSRPFTRRQIDAGPCRVLVHLFQAPARAAFLRDLVPGAVTAGTGAAGLATHEANQVCGIHSAQVGHVLTRALLGQVVPKRSGVPVRRVVHHKAGRRRVREEKLVKVLAPGGSFLGQLCHLRCAGGVEALHVCLNRDVLRWLPLRLGDVLLHGYLAHRLARHCLKGHSWEAKRHLDVLVELHHEVLVPAAVGFLHGLHRSAQGLQDEEPGPRQQPSHDHEDQKGLHLRAAHPHRPRDPEHTPPLILTLPHLGKPGLAPTAAVAHLDGLQVLDLQLQLLGQQRREDHLVDLEDGAQSLFAMQEATAPAELACC